MAETYLDILNQEGEKTGQSRPYLDIHKKGLIHRSVHVWILNSENKILLQKRNADMKACPNYWDISASGHIEAGQTSLEGAQMETREELGLTLPEDAFVYLFTVKQNFILNQSTFIDNEFQDVYLVRLNVVSPDIRISTKELSEVKWVSINEFKLLIDKKDSNLVPHKEEYNRLLTYLS